jgi:hypothetical protein
MTVRVPLAKTVPQERVSPPSVRRPQSDATNVAARWRAGYISPDPADVFALQSTVGNRVVSRLIARPAVPVAVQRSVAKLGGGESLQIADGLPIRERRKAIAEAKAIIKDIKQTYGVTISSTGSVKAILKDYFPGKKAPKAIQKAIQPAPWKIEELRNVQTALKHYAPMLGKERKKSSDPAISKTKQKITSIGKVGKALSPDATKPFGVEVETDTLGESFASSKNIAFFQALATSTKNFPGDNPAQQRGTTAHELSHALVQPEHIGAFVSTFADYWQDESTRIADDDRTSTASPPAEAPISYYGGTNAGEDLAETAKFYFEAPARLKGGDGKPKGEPGNPAPRRFDFFHRIVLSWTKTPAQVSTQRYQELAADFIALRGKPLLEVITAKKQLDDELVKVPEAKRKELRKLEEQVNSKYVDLAMDAF